MPLRHILDDTFSSAWWRFVRLWRPMAGWTFLNYLAAGLIIVPLLSSLLGLIVFRGDRIMVGNEDLAAWLLSPIGLAYLLATGALAMAVAVIRYAGLFRILVDDLDGRRVSVRQTFVELVPDVPGILRLCVAAVVLGLLLLLPLAAAIAGIYFAMLGDHDINFYLYERPSEWRNALVATGFVVVAWLIPAVYVGLRTVPALPAFLDGHRPLRRSVREAWARTRGDSPRALKLFVMCVIVWIVARVTLHGAYALIAAPAWRFLDAVVDSLTPLLLATVIWAAGTFVLDLIVSFFGFSLAATVLTKFYFEDTDLHQRAPRVPLGLRALPRRAVRRLLWWLHPYRLLPTLAAILIVSLTASALLLRPLGDDIEFEIAAHRAGAFLGVENTLGTLELAIEAGADYAEIDLQLSRDSVVVIVHDADMMRLAGDPRRIAEMDAADILALPLNAPSGTEADQLRVATLDDVLERAAGRIGLMLELKYYGFDPDLAPAAIEAVRRHQMEDDVIFISLSHRGVEQVQNLAPDLRTGFIATVAAGDVTRLPVDLLAVGRPLASPSLIRSARRQGVQVHVWTLNTLATMLAAVDRGADGIITDDPALAVALRRELAALSPAERLILRLRNLLPDVETYLSNGGSSMAQP